MTRTYGVGIMGAGNISHAYLQLAPLFRNLDVRAVADIRSDVARERAQEYGVAVHTPETLLADPAIDVVVNLTVPEAHFSVSKQIISAGKHAYSEKPFVLSVEEGKALKALADEKGVRVGSAPDTFLGGAHQQARKMIDEGAIGRIVSGTCHVMSFGMEHWHPNPDFFFKPGAGPILDIGPYYITNLINLVGPVRRVTAISGKARDKREIKSEPRRGEFVSVETPTTIHAVMEFANGAIITLGASWDVEVHEHRNMELYGTEGTLFVPDPNFFGGDLIEARREGHRETVTPWHHALGVPNWERPAGPSFANYRAAGLSDMMHAIEEGRASRCGLELALHAVDIMTSILKSGETGNAVTLETSCERPAPLAPEEAQTLLRD